MAAGRVLCLSVVLTLAVFAGYSLAASESENGNERVGKSNFWSRFADGFRAIEEQAHSQLEQAMSGLVGNLGANVNTRVGTASLAHPTQEDEDDDDDDDDDDEDSVPSAAGHVGIHTFNFGPSTFDSSFGGGLGSGLPSVLASFGGLFGGNEWWKGPNVCVERKDVLDTPDETKPTEKSIEATTKADSDGDEATTSTTERDREELEDDDDDDEKKPMMRPEPIISSFNSFQIYSCRDLPDVHQCTTTTRTNGVSRSIVVRHTCCPGHRRIPGQPGCEKFVVRSIRDTLSDVGADMFSNLIQSAGLGKSVEGDANVTVFAPTDSALRDYTDSVMDQNTLARIRRDVDKAANPEDNEIKPGKPEGRDLGSRTLEAGEVVMTHMVPGLQELRKLGRDTLLHTSLDNSTIRINKYAGVVSPLIMTANCVRITKADKVATNGIVNVVDKMLPIVPRDRTLATILESDPELSTFLLLLQRRGLMDKLREEGPLTILAPTNEAFDQLDETTRSHLLEGVCDSTVVKHHISPSMLCSTAFSSGLHVSNLNNEYSTVSEKDGKYFFGDAELISKDVLASNGVLHKVNKVQVTDEARTLSTVLEQKNMTLWRDVLKRLDLLDKYDRDTNFTMIIPSQTALQKDIPLLIQMHDDGDEGATTALRDIVAYHTIKPAVTACMMENNKMLHSELKSVGENASNVRVNIFSQGPFLRPQVTFQCTRVAVLGEPACGGRVFVTNRILKPAMSSIAEILADTEYSEFRKMLEASGMLKKLAEEGEFTVLAPINSAFEGLSASDRSKLEKKDVAEEVVKMHIIPMALCCSGVTNMWPFESVVSTLSDNYSPSVSRNPHGEVRIGDANVFNCDTMAYNGIVHAVDRVTIPRPKRRQSIIFKPRENPDTEIVLYGL